MKKDVHPEPRFVVCVRNDNYELDLTLHKIYQVLPDASAERSGRIRIVDETGEDYLYPETFFRPVEVTRALEAELLRAS